MMMVDEWKEVKMKGKVMAVDEERKVMKGKEDHVSPYVVVVVVWRMMRRRRRIII